MKKAKKKIQKFIDEAERMLAAKYFTLSNTAMLEVVPGTDLNDMYRRGDDLMAMETGCGLREELNSWKEMIADGDSYCYDEWQKVKATYIKVEVTA